MDRTVVENAARELERRLPARPTLGIILGSGLAPVAAAVEERVVIPTTELPGYPPSTIEGHAGEFVAGTLAGRRVLVLNGRIHAYEGHSLDVVTLPVRIMAACGVETLIVTNAAGGLDPSFAVGDVMIIEDHLNLHGASPLTGPNVDAWGPRFPDMSEVYDRRLRDLAARAGRAAGLTVHRGVYASVPGPQYETPAEIRMLSTLGASAVGMSTVPEAIVARHMGRAVLGLSLITNAAAGLGEEPLSHDEVVAAGEQARARFTDMVLGVLREDAS